MPHRAVAPSYEGASPDRPVSIHHAVIAAACLALAGCDPAPGAPPDAGAEEDAGGEARPLSTAHCSYRALPSTARAGGTVAPGAVRAGAAERALDLPVGTALGGNTSRASLIDNQGWVDGRQVPLSGSFNPSVGIETIPRVKALALSAGDETIVILRTDTIFGDDTITHEVTERLGPDLAGKVLWVSTHTHTAAAQYSADLKFQVGAGRVRASVRARLIDRMVEAAEAALAAQVPARIGVATDEDFDPEDHVSYDRRDENDDALFGGEARKDRRLALIRVDTADGEPLAIVPIFGVHSAILDDDVSVFSTDASGAFERALEERFDREVMVMHVQGAAGDVLGASHSHVEFPEGAPRWDFARTEECARWALPALVAAWERAGESMQGELAMEMVTRSVEMGPDWRTFSVRGGALSYAPWDGTRACDGRVFGSDGALLSPIDEFNAPAGAAICGEDGPPQLPTAQMPGTDGLTGYSSCMQIERVTRTLGILLDFEFGQMPICSSTRTTIGALRIGDFMFGLAPGEPVVHWRDRVAERSPFPVERTFVIGYALGHNGYLLMPEDWVLGGYEPSINSWGPLEGEHLAEGIVELMRLAATDAREDAAAGGADGVVAGPLDDRGVPAPDAAPLAGTVPATVPDEVYLRNGVHVASAEPASPVERVSGIARFVWIGEDPTSGTPRVTLEREVGGAFEPVRRRSGRAVEDLDLIVVWTPIPLAYTAGEARTHYWSVEWQAVSWELGPLDERVGLPLGRYRFHVEGTGYALDSDAFEVVAGSLEVVARREGAELAIEARFQPREGWRLLSLEGLANRDVAAEAGPLTVVVEDAGGGSETIEAALIAPGTVRVTPASAAPVRVVVRDRYGNEGAAALSSD